MANTDTQKRRGRPAGSGNPTLKLKCLVTGAARATNMKYLQAKADRLGVKVEDIVTNYVSKAGLKQLDSFETSLNKETIRRINGGTRIRVEKVALAKAA